MNCHKNKSVDNLEVPVGVASLVHVARVEKKSSQSARALYSCQLQCSLQDSELFVSVTPEAVLSKTICFLGRLAAPLKVTN